MLNINKYSFFLAPIPNIQRVGTVTRTYKTRSIVLIAKRIETDEDILGQLVFNIEKLEIVVGRQTPGLINCREVVLKIKLHAE